MLAASWSPEQWALIIPILGLQVIGIITAWKRGGQAVSTAERATQQVEAVHHELRPPSNSTTTGAYVEFMAQAIPWMVEELMLMHKTLGTLPRHPPPAAPPDVSPPLRPR